jgi:hypothetical protein
MWNGDPPTPLPRGLAPCLQVELYLQITSSRYNPSLWARSPQAFGFRRLQISLFLYQAVLSKPGVLYLKLKCSIVLVDSESTADT